MKKINQLKSILDIVIGFSIVVMVASLFGILLGLVTGNMSKLNVTIAGEKTDHFDAAFVIVALLMAVGYGLFIYAIYKLKKLIALFVRKDFFTDVSVSTLKTIGVSMLVSSLLITIPTYLYGAMNDATIHLKMSTIRPESMAFSIIISLFFIILSYIFDEAKRIKDENELTI